MIRSLRTAAAVAGLVLVALLVRADEKKPPAEKKFSPEEVAFFEKEVAPILQQHCV